MNFVKKQFTSYENQPCEVQYKFNIERNVKHASIPVYYVQTACLWQFDGNNTWPIMSLILSTRFSHKLTRK